MKPEIYKNKKGEWVMTYDLFKKLEVKQILNPR